MFSSALVTQGAGRENVPALVITQHSTGLCCTEGRSLMGTGNSAETRLL